MENIRLTIRYDGLDARWHALDMRMLGESMIGLDRALTLGLSEIFTGEQPRPRQPLPLVIRATPPRDGCLQYDALIEHAQGVLPIVLPIATGVAARVAKDLIAAILKRRGGKPSQSEQHVERIIEQIGADRHREREMIYRLVDRLAPLAKQIVSPVGKSCETLAISDGTEEAATEIDVAMAQAIRSKDELEVGEMTKMRLKVDGVIVHSRSLKVGDPDDPTRYITAEVRDPAFGEGENIYTQSVTKFLDVEAKPTYRDGRLHKLHIMDARPSDG